jgi:hypothetical protein
MVVIGINGYVTMLLLMVEHKSKTFAHTCSQSPHFCHFIFVKQIFKWARDSLAPSEIVSQADWGEYTCACAAENGHLEILKWVRNSLVTFGNACLWNSNVYYYAASNGQLDVLKWARYSLVTFGNGCDWDSDTYSNARYKWTFRSFKVS